MSLEFEEEVVRMLSPKIKSVLRQTQQQYQDDLEQELIVMILKKIKDKDNFSNTPSFFNLIKKQTI